MREEGGRRREEEKRGGGRRGVGGHCQRGMVGEGIGVMV